MNDRQEKSAEDAQVRSVEAGNHLEQNRRLNDDSDLVQSFTRLILGGAVEGWRELTTRLRSWEEEAKSVQESLPEESSIIIIDNEGPEQEETPPAESQSKILRLAMTGLLFRAESRMVRRRRRVLNAANRTTTTVMKPLVSWAADQQQLRPAKNRFETLVRRGELVSRSWIERGRVEDARSRQLVRTAAQDSFTGTMDELGSAPALQDLVRKQSAGLTQEALDEARVRTVGGDYILEHFMRSILRRLPRSQLPPPTSADNSPEESDV